MKFLSLYHFKGGKTIQMYSISLICFTIRYSKTIQFNKPVSLNDDFPQVSYLKQQSSNKNKSCEKPPQALGTIASGKLSNFVILFMNLKQLLI